MFFDEFDTLVKERGDPHDTGEIKRVVSGLLLQIDDLPSHVVVITATNHAELLDRAAWRGSRFRLHLPPPTAEQVAQSLEDFAVVVGADPGTAATKLAPLMDGRALPPILELVQTDVKRRIVLGQGAADIDSVLAAVVHAWSTQRMTSAIRVDAWLPHLLLPTPTRVDRRSLTGLVALRLDPVLDAKASALSVAFKTSKVRRGRRGLGQVSGEPEELVVLETVGRIDDLARAISRIPGMEWLGDVDIDELLPEPTFLEPQPEPTPGRLYLVMSSQEGIDELIRLWRIYLEQGDRATFPYGLSKWRDVFAGLNNIRRWGPEDRVRETGLEQDVEFPRALGQQAVGIELELWYRENPASRRTATAAISELVPSRRKAQLRERH